MSGLTRVCTINSTDKTVNGRSRTYFARIYPATKPEPVRNSMTAVSRMNGEYPARFHCTIMYTIRKTSAIAKVHPNKVRASDSTRVPKER